MSAYLTPDQAIVLAVLLGGFGVISLLSSLADQRFPVLGAGLLLVTGFLILSMPEGVGFGDVPQAFVAVLADLLD